MEFAIVNNYMGPVATKPMKGYSEENIAQTTQTGSGSKVRCLFFVSTQLNTHHLTFFSEIRFDPFQDGNEFMHILILYFISFVLFLVIVIREHLSSIDHRLHHSMINAAMDGQRHSISINFHGFSSHFLFSF